MIAPSSISLRPPKADRVLFVAWQEAHTRTFRPVGRLTRRWDTVTEQPRYEFVYTRGADMAEGFEPFLAFPDLDQIYVTRRLFPFFTNRLMSPRRPDYQDYARRAGLDPQTADEFDLLVRTAGIRATDPIELFGMPDLVLDEETGRPAYEIWFFVHGFRHLQPYEQEAAMRLEPGNRLNCCPEPENPADAQAMVLLEVDGVRVGYLPRYLAPDAAELHGNCSGITITVEQVHPDPAPVNQRLLCRMRACLPMEAAPFNTPACTPRVTEAWPLANPLKNLNAF